MTRQALTGSLIMTLLYQSDINNDLVLTTKLDGRVVMTRIRISCKRRERERRENQKIEGRIVSNGEREEMKERENQD